MFLVFAASFAALIALIALPSAIVTGNTVTFARNVGMLVIMGTMLGVSISQTAMLFYGNVFGCTGYLTLTLPVSRGHLYLSKLLIAAIWVAMATVIMQFGMIITQLPWRVVVRYGTEDIVSQRPLLTDLLVSGLPAHIPFISSAFFIAVIIFFGVTLSNSVFGNIRVSAAPAWFVSIGLVIMYIVLNAYVNSQLTDRTVIESTRMIDGIMHHYSISTIRPVLGFEVGFRLTGNAHQVNYMNFNMLLVSVPLTAATIAATYYLLKKRISL